MTEHDQALIDEIFSIRIRNNIPWKKILEIAMEHAPAETRKALLQIDANDTKISHLNRKLSK